MRNLDGMEMFCFTKSKHFELEYRGKGTYAEPNGKPIEDLIDMTCYGCTSSYYTRDGDPIPFCPNCGTFEKKKFADEKLIIEALTGQDFTWLKRNGLKPFIVKTRNNTWELRFAREASALEGTGAYDRVKPI
jgi:hypothetical protein